MKIRTLADRMLRGHLDEVGIVCKVIGGRPGTMLDVGAHYGSSSAPFLARGWSVHAFEPDPVNRAVLSANYPAAKVDPRAIAEFDGARVSLFTSDVSTGISALSPFHPTHAPTATVETVRLDTYIQTNGLDRVDFLKTDVEGHDLAALRTFPWDSQKPRAVVCEFEDKKTVPLGHEARDIAEFLADKGYAVLVSEWEPIVEYGSTHRWRRFAPFPSEIPADSWGNLIAVDPELLDRLNRSARSAAWKLYFRRRLGRYFPSN